MREQLSRCLAASHGQPTVPGLDSTKALAYEHREGKKNKGRKKMKKEKKKDEKGPMLLIPLLGKNIQSIFG